MNTEHYVGSEALSTFKQSPKAKHLHVEMCFLYAAYVLRLCDKQTPPGYGHKRRLEDAIIDLSNKAWASIPWRRVVIDKKLPTLKQLEQRLTRTSRAYKRLK